ncbi:MAG TPA: ABC transporter ATP-binding protein [Persephonella sp.]|uniref:Lipoprotein-releasing system ATP-binding protein LolD n=1 Tax=Persephonella marina (strain DSM 14350 / EX-H1) TaxID=123214 RepID=C0QS56_PERMH|nr:MULTISPECIES: ABC transporter ATP-binding protein [Persephonella]ACO03831.1 lipoprotein-releasing system ATP-binding protein LolD [Persephonella marina EX-H1]HCB69246.1 ABC transporter ATP-binding protein [Persephonella sp.]
MSSIAIKTENLKKIYFLEGAQIDALKGIDLEIYEGEMVALMGPSGSGKSTLLHLIGGIDIPTEGKVFIHGTDIFSLNEKRLARFRNENIGFVFQFHYLLPEFTALENVMFPVQIYSKGDAEEKAREILERLGLSHRINHKPSQMSGGEQQRVAIARAIVNRPSIIIADEPTGNLDSRNTETVMKIFREMNDKDNVTIIIATHDKDVANYCKRTIYLRDGILVNE